MTGVSLSLLGPLYGSMMISNGSPSTTTKDGEMQDGRSRKQRISTGRLGVQAWIRGDRGGGRAPPGGRSWRKLGLPREYAHSKTWTNDALHAHPS